MKKSAILSAALLGCVLFPRSGVGSGTADVRIVDLAGLEAAISDQRGKGVLLNFWAIWCAPCLAELPHLVETASEYAARDGAVLGVSYDFMVPGVTREDVLQQVSDFVADRGIDIPILIYEADDYDAINARFSLPGPIPVTLAIDRNGEIVDRQEREADKDRFTAMMEKALGN